MSFLTNIHLLSYILYNEITPEKNICILNIVLSLKFWFKSFNLLHISFSVCFILFLFFLFFKSLFFSATSLLFIFLFSTRSLTSFSSILLKSSIFLVFVHKHMFCCGYLRNFGDFSLMILFFSCLCKF